MPNRSVRQVLIRSAAVPKALSIATYFAERGWIIRLDLAEGAGPVNALVANMKIEMKRTKTRPRHCPGRLSRQRPRTGSRTPAEPFRPRLVVRNDKGPILVGTGCAVVALVERGRTSRSARGGLSEPLPPLRSGPFPGFAWRSDRQSEFTALAREPLMGG